MSIWKQLAVTLVMLLVAAGLWIRFFPGAGDVLADYGLDWIPIQTAGTDANATAGAPGRGPGGFGGGQQSGVYTMPVREATINDRLTAIGTGRANQSVIVTPYATGRLTRYNVSAGARVEAGDVVAELDSDSEEIAVDRARISLRDAQARLERVEQLRQSNTATTVQLNEAALAVENAQLELRNAELALERRSIRAPIAGVVGILPINAGNYVTTQTEIATIDDRSSLIVDFWVPERFAGMIEVGTPLRASSVARPGEVHEGEVGAIDNRVDAQSRTLRIQARLDNPGDRLRAGMAFQVELRFPGDTFPSVDPLAVQWGTDGAFVWTVRSGRAERVPVRIVQRNTESVLVDAALAPGDSVVTEGIHVVREGAEVRVASRNTGGASSIPVAVDTAPASGS